MSLVVVRLFPVGGEAVSGSAFSSYLDGLTIRVFDLATSAPEAQVGQAATHVPLPDPTSPQNPDPTTGIVQHFTLGPFAAFVLQAAATAVFEVAPPHPPAGRPEHTTRDLRIEITRNGTLVDRRLYFNVPEASGGMPADRSTFPGLEPTALYIGLPAAGSEILPTDAYVELPGDGSPVPYAPLLNAVARVLGDDPGGPLALAGLTVPQAKHVAREIVWNQKVRPLPGPNSADIGAMYTEPTSTSADSARDKFEAELTAYYAAGDADAERLAGYIVALCSAVAAEARSTAETTLGLTFPVLPGQTGTGERYQRVRVVLTGLPATVRATVPARYFYALGVALPISFDADQRYRAAVLADEERLRTGLVAARDSGVIAETPPPAPPGLPVGQPPAADAPPVGIAQAVRRLRTLGDITGTPPTLPVGGDVQTLLQAWLATTAADIDPAFWDGIVGTHPSGHLDLVLTALTRGYVVPADSVRLSVKIRNHLGVVDAPAVAATTTQQWETAFRTDATWPANLPDWTRPGSDTERLTAFVNEVRKFFDITVSVPPATTAPTGAPPLLRVPAGDPINRFVAAYAARAGAPFVFGAAWNAADRAGAVDHVSTALFGPDPAARRWLDEIVTTIDELVRLASVVPAPVRFSVCEALFARGFTSRTQVAAMTLQAFRDALVGTVAFEFADAICTGAGGPGTEPAPSEGGFVPVNPDGCLIDCIAPEHLSPTGPVAYLQALLALPVTASCKNLSVEGETLGEQVSSRRGPLGDLHATAANTRTQLPVVDLVDECLESLAGNPGSRAGVVYDAATDVLAGHALAGGTPPDPGSYQHDPGSYQHDPARLFAALPEHSTPAVPVATPAAFSALRHDFSHPALPYAQGPDVNRTYLCALGTSRFEVMRRFRRDITELVLDPAAEPAAFRRHVWRYPVRLDLALEYLCISREEYDTLYARDLVTSSRADGGNDGENTPGLPVWRVYGFERERIGRQRWTQFVVRLPEFLPRTGLDWCEFLELWRSQLVPFGRVSPQQPNDNPEYQGARGFEDCEPCHLDQYVIDLRNVHDLRKLAVITRLWRTVRDGCRPALTFAELADVCIVLGLFTPSGSVNPDFIRQLAAFQMLRQEFGLMLRGRDPVPAGARGIERTPLLGLWTGPGSPQWTWAVGALLDRVQRHAIRRFKCRLRPPKFIELLAANLDPISRIIGFDPDQPADTWHARPTHTLRLTELLAKLYASDLGVGQMLFLFTADDHPQGDDPFALQPANEALDDPLALPDDDTGHSLWALRNAMLDVRVGDDEAVEWTWPRIDATLRSELRYASTPGNDPLYTLGARFFPSVLEQAGIPVPEADRRYRVALPGSPPAMWNSPAAGPFRYVAGDLTATLPLTPAAVIQKLSRIRQLTTDEQAAVRELTAGPLADLAPLAFLFEDLEEAVLHLVAEPDEGARFAYFRRSVARCLARCQVIADHLAGHVVAVTEVDHGEAGRLAWQLLAHLFGDENRAVAPWENDSGATPAVTWPNPPTGGAFAALLALTGTGLLGEYRVPTAKSAVSWRELRGPLRPFGSAQNAVNAPLPGRIPQLGATVSAVAGQFVAIRNGFAITSPAGGQLGGGQGYTVRWTGSLLVDERGDYTFHAGSPAPDGELPDHDEAEGRHWRVVLRRGQRSWVLLSHRWPNEHGAPDHRATLELRHGAYDIEIELVQPDPDFDDPDDIFAATGGFQLSYAGPDTGGRPVAIPRERLFRRTREPLQLDEGIEGLTPAEQQALAGRYTGSLRDIRRTYQRAFKALLLAHQLNLSAAPIADDGQSEIGYLLAHPNEFSGTAYYRSGGGFAVHLAGFDPNLLPVEDSYYSPAAGADQRVAPSVQRRQAMTDWWERLFDYTVVRRMSSGSPERPTWLLFHESAEGHPDIEADLLRYLGADLRRAALVRRYDPGVELDSTDLVDEQWPIRIWHADVGLRRILQRFYPADIRTARPDLWATLDPSNPPDATSGNANLTEFVRAGYLESGPPRRYSDVARLNDGLRDRGRAALLAYLCAMNRVMLPWGTPAREPRHLSDLLLLDVEAGLCERASRIDEAISAVQTLVSRARLGLEPGLTLSPEFLRLWDARFATFRIWEACRQRALYRENWVDIDELAAAQQTEAFQFLEAELRRATVTRPSPGGLECWLAPPLPEHPGLMMLQVRDPSGLQWVDPVHHGFDLMGTPDRHARPSWLAAVGLPAIERNQGEGNDDNADLPDNPDDDRPGPLGAGDGDSRAVVARDEQGETSVPARLPWWIKSAVRLGTRFLRVAAAGIPPAASLASEMRTGAAASSCCAECGGEHDSLVDEYYFWLADARWFDAQIQDAGWDWHNQDALPGLLAWRDNAQMVLAWSRVHNGELGQVRHSVEGVRLSGPAELLFAARVDDSLTFVVDGGTAPPGYPATPAPGFRYDLAADDAVVLPEVPPVPPIPPPAGPPSGPLHPGQLPSYPYFAYHAPGAPLFPGTPYSPAISIAAVLRAHCHPEAALRWYELAFDPLNEDSSWLRCQNGSTDRPARGLGLCCTDSTQATPDEVRRRSILLHYLETLVQWNDQLMRHRPTPEAATQARAIMDAAATLLGACPRVIVDSDLPNPAPTVTAFIPHPARPNPRLLKLYDEVADRLALIRACMNGYRLRIGRFGVDMSYFGNSELVDGWIEPPGPCLDEDWCLPNSPYRFGFLLPKAVELATQVRSLGSALLNAHERGDVEYLASLRADHEQQLIALTRQIRQMQWRDADWQVQALGKAKQSAQTDRRYFADLVEAGLNGGEDDYVSLIEQAVSAYGNSIPLDAIGQAMGWIPDIWLGVAGMGPLNANQLALGTKLAGVFATAARIANTVGQIAATTSGKRLTQAGWERREAEWRHQVEMLDIEIDRIERQILGAERVRDSSLRELNNNERQLENSRRIAEVERDKLTGHALFLWLQQETAALYYQAFELALRSARQAQRAFNFERGHTAQDFLDLPLWDSLHEGLLAGERLELSLRRMEHTYLDLNAREYEVTKHISLRLAFPMEFLTLLATGSCEIELPEWLFDLDYPGQYLRRIKNVSLSIPGVLGPYSGVHARLTLLSSTTRVRPELTREPPACCTECSGGSACACGSHGGDCGEGCCDCPCCCSSGPCVEPELDGYSLLPGDTRAVREYVARQAIATSTGQTDAGMFEVDFRDERYLPFEFHGAVSRWRLELPPENNQFDVSTVGDAVFHLSYTAREGGENLRRAAGRVARDHLPGDGLCLLDLAQDLPDAWQAMQQQWEGGGRRFPLRLSRAVFPFVPGVRDLDVMSIAFLIEAPCALPSRHHTVRFYPTVPNPDEWERVEFQDIECIAGAEWPGMFHGVLENLYRGRVPGDREALLGFVQLPDNLGAISRMWLICGYTTASKHCGRSGDRTRTDKVALRI